MVAAASAGICSLWGFYRVSCRLPQTLTHTEMLQTIVSANLFGFRKESVVDRECRRWTGGLIRGLPVGALAVDGLVIEPSGVSFSSVNCGKETRLLLPILAHTRALFIANA